MQYGLCIEMAFAKLPFEDRIRRAADLGFRNVEMWLVDGSWKGSPGRLLHAAEQNNVRITNTVIGTPDGSIGGGLTEPTNRPQWLERARMTIDFTRHAGIPATIVCTGNVVRGLSDEQMLTSVIDGLKATAELAEKAGVTLLLEPLNTAIDHAGYWLTGSDRGAEICRRVGSRRMRLLFDCYHMQIMEGNLVRHIERNIDVIGHFHAAGVPGRHEPFLGEINYPYLLAQIAKLGYAGVFALEYEPTMDDAASVQRTLKYLGSWETM